MSPATTRSENQFLPQNLQLRHATAKAVRLRLLKRQKGQHIS
jgi:hypothetical protein